MDKNDTEHELWQGTGYFEFTPDAPQLVGNAPQMQVCGPIASIDYEIGATIATVRCDVCGTRIEVPVSDGVVAVPPHVCDLSRRIRRAFEA